ncbi:MAG: metallophosphoesterase [Burkholderiaceae bacterium]|jgi:hypothetical protein|nr:metallophosphoesterase [Burkholderiaceae bacterium]
MMQSEFTPRPHAPFGRTADRGRDGCRRGSALAQLLAWVGAACIGLAAGGCGGGSPAPAAFNVATAGDIAECFGGPAANSAAAKTAALVRSDDAFVLTLGDNAYQNGTPQEFADCFHPTWGAFKDRIHAGIGNHDIYTENAEGYYGYFGARAGPDRRGYYSFDYGGWHFIMLNSLLEDLSTDSAQYKWLVADLERTRGTLCTVAFWHYPYFNSGAKYGGFTPIKAFFEALYNGGVEILLSGHDHLYERFAPQTAAGVADPVRGVRQFVVGTGGASLNKFGTPAANSEVRIEGVWGILRLTLDDGSYNWQFMPAGGGPALDSGRGLCHR